MGTRDNRKSVEYTVSEAIDAGMFPWTSMMSRRKQYAEITRAIKRDYLGKNVLKARIEGTGTNTRYRFTSANYYKFKEMYGPGLTLLAENKKTWKQPTQSK